MAAEELASAFPGPRLVSTRDAQIAGPTAAATAARSGAFPPGDASAGGGNAATVAAESSPSLGYFFIRAYAHNMQRNCKLACFQYCVWLGQPGPRSMSHELLCSPPEHQPPWTLNLKP